MTTPSTKTDVISLIERVRRAMPLNRDVMEIAELLERAVVSTQRNVVSTNEPVVSTRRPAVVSTQCQCEPCVRRRAAKAQAMKRWRARRGGSIVGSSGTVDSVQMASIDPMEAEIS